MILETMKTTALKRSVEVSDIESSWWNQCDNVRRREVGGAEAKKEQVDNVRLKKRKQVDSVGLEEKEESKSIMLRQKEKEGSKSRKSC